MTQVAPTVVHSPFSCSARLIATFSAVDDHWLRCPRPFETISADVYAVFNSDGLKDPDVSGAPSVFGPPVDEFETIDDNIDLVKWDFIVNSVNSAHS